MTTTQMANLYVGKHPDFVWDTEEIYYNGTDYKLYLAYIAGAKGKFRSTKKFHQAVQKAINSPWLYDNITDIKDEYYKQTRMFLKY